MNKVSQVVPKKLRPGRQDRLLGIALMVLMASELLGRMTHAPIAHHFAWGAMAAAVSLAARQMGIRECYLFGLCVALTVVLIENSRAPAREIMEALSQASFLMSFILLLGLLHEAATSSPSIEVMGRYLSRQPAGRRFYALFAGTGAMSVLFNLGVLSFLVPLVQRGARSRDPQDPLNPIRERRQISALHRGFAWSVIWSPTAIAPLALIELIPGVERRTWIFIGFGIFLLYMVLGALEDRLRWRAVRPRSKQPNPLLPRRALGMFVLACTWLLGLSVVVSWLLDDTVIFGLMASCPIVMAGWIAAQNWTGQRIAWGAVGQRLNEIVGVNLAQSARVAITLGCSGFIGRAASSLVPSQSVAETLGLLVLPDFVVLSAIPLVIAALSLLALSPITTAVFFGSFFGNLDVLPADPTLIALAISMGWSLSMLLSPISTVVLIVNRVSGIAPTVLTWKFNLLYGLFCAAANVAVFAALTWFIG